MLLVKKNERKPVTKKVYSKPVVHRVELHPEESMAAGCKTISGMAPAANPCIAGSCFLDGS